MPLPATDTGAVWPPKAARDIHYQIAEWSAWYEGKADALSAYYRNAQATTNPVTRPSQLQGGVIGAWSRFWWGKPAADDNGQRVNQLHIPLAADIAQAAADLLYAEPPELVLPDDTSARTRERLDAIFDEDAHELLSTGAEMGAALGGRFHRVAWDKTLADSAFLTTVDADAAWPEFRYGRLVAVTFWWVISRDGQMWYRHLERHELDAEGNGLVQHGLYQGSQDQLGSPRPLEEHPSTAPLASQVDELGYLKEGRSKGLMVVYVPNVLPNRTWRSDPTGRYLGRASIDGAEPALDFLDETYTSWRRDIQLAKSRILIPDYMLKSGGPGQGASFDYDRELYVPIRSAAPEDADASIILNQFSIRVQEHQETIKDVTEVILRHAGYSAQTFGEGGDAAAATATEIVARERRSYLTSGRRKRIEGQRVSTLLGKLLATDALIFNSGAEAVDPQVIFGDAVQDSPLTLAQTALAMDQARAASTEVKVRLLHPDWDEDAVAAEVAQISDDAAANAPADPFATGV